MAASSEEAPRKIPSRERTAAQMPLVFRGVPLPCASKDYLGLLSQGEASIAFCQASAHCDGSGSLSPRRRTHRPSAPTDRRGWPRKNRTSGGPAVWAGCPEIPGEGPYASPPPRRRVSRPPPPAESPTTHLST